MAEILNDRGGDLNEDCKGRLNQVDLVLGGGDQPLDPSESGFEGTHPSSTATITRSGTGQVGSN